MRDSDVWIEVFQKLAALDGNLENGIDPAIQIKKLKRYFKGESSLKVRASCTFRPYAYNNDSFLSNMTYHLWCNVRLLVSLITLAIFQTAILFSDGFPKYYRATSA